MNKLTLLLFLLFAGFCLYFQSMTLVLGMAIMSFVYLCSAYFDSFSIEKRYLQGRMAVLEDALKQHEQKVKNIQADLSSVKLSAGIRNLNK